ncbi:MAG TPA: S1/P1 nuclease, partial [Saprospiraceae bacterium]|nr:S1/P1 nuclease [Saprospiraceae bacterium]
MRTITFLLLTFSLPLSLSADWGANGHRIVAKICYDNLTEQARAAVDEALGDNYLEQVANWPDYI